MHVALLVGHVLTCLVALEVLPVNGQATTCCENCCEETTTCNAPSPYNITLTEFVSLQPLYVVFYPQIPIYAGDNSACYTFSPLSDGTYLWTLNRVYSSQYNTSKCFTMAMKQPGFFLAGSALTTITVNIIDYLQTQDCSVYLVYLCFDYGQNMFHCGNNIPAYGLSTNNAPISSACLVSAVDRLRQHGVPSQTYLALPMDLPSGCDSVCFD